jgi:hypothetical protein
MCIVRSALLASSLVAVACAGQTAPAKPPLAEAPLAAAAPAESVAPVDAGEPAKVETPNEAAGTEAPPSASPPSESDPNATREVTYVVVPEGMKVSVAGVRFAVSASAVQVASGWGVKLNVVATSVDGKPHWLSDPKTGPLAFAGSVLQKARSQAEPFGDERTGEGEQSISAAEATKFSRSWPAKGGRGLALGDSLDLQVALWGLGSEKDSRRPVKKFCHVRMQVGKGKPRAIVEPPPGISSK